jgi:hypothetical protein
MSKPELVVEKFVPPSFRDWRAPGTLDGILFWLYGNKELKLNETIDHKNQFLRFSYCYDDDDIDLYGKPVIILRVHKMNIGAMSFPEQKEQVKTIQLKGNHPLEVLDGKLNRGFFFSY